MAASTPSRSVPQALQSRARGSSTPLSPTRITRLQEKEDLRHLNDRLAVYIDRVRSLELENDKLMVEISEKEEVTTREVSGVKALYETELADARNVLDETARDKARLQIELGKYRSDLDETTKNFKKKDADLLLAQQRNKELEALYSSSEAKLNTALDQKRNLEADLADLNARLAKAEEAHAVAKKQLEKETLMRVDAENRCQSLREDLEFRKNVYEEEFKETRRRHERSLVEVDKGQKYDHESKLAQALEELRKQHDEQVDIYRDELEQNYQAKLDNIKSSSDHNDQAAETAREELTEARMRMETLGYQLTGLQKQLSAAEARVCELEELLSSDRNKYRKLLDHKEKEMAALRDHIQMQLTEYQELLDVKLALDMEINAYRKLLEGEEERLKLSPSPHSNVTLSRVTSSSSSSATHQSSSKRKRMEAEESEEGGDIQTSGSWSRIFTRGSSRSGGFEGSGTITSGRSSSSKFQISQQSTMTGNITIEEIDLEGKFIHLKNHSDKDQSLGSWRLKLNIGDKDMVYKFTPKYVLTANQSVKIYSADAGVAHNPPSILVWKNQSSWATDSNIKISVMNSEDEQVAVRTVSKSVLSSVEEDEVDEEAEFGEEDLFHQQSTSAPNIAKLFFL
ncbi:lamin-B2 isoform X2 [Mixophyes fleayi]|uniref:lamin-B2 isoform X2 n=1 Tax=Mixophyes fleayi TaxID=3061075 RepID=UPI003F4DD999